MTMSPLPVASGLSWASPAPPKLANRRAPAHLNSRRMSTVMVHLSQVPPEPAGPPPPRAPCPGPRQTPRPLTLKNARRRVHVLPPPGTSLAPLELLSLPRSPARPPRPGSIERGGPRQSEEPPPARFKTNAADRVAPAGRDRESRGRCYFTVIFVTTVSFTSIVTSLPTATSPSILVSPVILYSFDASPTWTVIVLPDS